MCVLDGGNHSTARFFCFPDNNDDQQDVPAVTHSLYLAYKVLIHLNYHSVLSLVPRRLVR